MRNATFSAASNPFEVEDAIALEANEGSAYPISSTGLPTRLVSRAARLGCSSDLTAFARASRSAGVMSEVSCNDNISSGAVCYFCYRKNLPKLSPNLNICRSATRDPVARCRRHSCRVLLSLDADDRPI